MSSTTFIVRVFPLLCIIIKVRAVHIIFFEFRSFSVQHIDQDAATQMGSTHIIIL